MNQKTKPINMCHRFRFKLGNEIYSKLSIATDNDIDPNLSYELDSKFFSVLHRLFRSNLYNQMKSQISRIFIK